MKYVAPPRGERGLKPRLCLSAAHRPAVAPPRGERGLKRHEETMRRIEICRSPSWGAWIETRGMGIVRTDLSVAPPRGERGLKPPSYGRYLTLPWVAPPRGERGLKLRLRQTSAFGHRRSPSWGAWIETYQKYAINC